MYAKNPKSKQSWSVYLKLILLLTLGYLPLLSFRMCIKNDALTLSYPLFHYFSEQLSRGNVPWWHFNLHLGFPMHADPGFPFWSPITWLFALFGPNLYVYTLFIWTHILIAGTGMVRLSEWLRFNPATQLLLALAFCLSGFFVSHLQHPHYIFEAAFIPLALLYFLKSTYSPSLKNSLIFGITLFFLINSGYPSFAIAAMYFFVFLFISIWVSDKTSEAAPAGKSLLFIAISIITATLLSLPLLYSFLELYPDFNRNPSSALAHVSSGGMSIQSLLSMLFPIASVTGNSFFETDRAWNNIYCGSLNLILLLYALRNATHSLKIPLVLTGSLMLILSFHGQLKGIFNYLLPFYNMIHSNGGIRIYFIICSLILCGFGFEHFQKNRSYKSFKAIAAILLLIVFFAGILATVNFRLTETHSLRSFLKNLSLSNAILLQAIISTFFLLIFILYKNTPKVVLTAGIIEIIFIFGITLPFTGLGTHPTALVQQHLDSLISTHKNIISSNPLVHAPPPGDIFFKETAWFSRTPSVIAGNSYPSGFSQYMEFIKNDGFNRLNVNRFVTSVQMSRKQQQDITVSNLTIEGDRLAFSVYSPYQDDTIIIAQNFYRHWKFYTDGIRVNPVIKNTLSSIPVRKGMTAITAKYEPIPVIICFFISIFAWLVISILMINKKTNVYRNN